MSLKAVHLVFVTALTALTLGCGAWFLRLYRAPDGSRADLLFSCVSFAASVAVVVYGRYFLKKLKRISYL
jgi:hypothetical protein